MIQPATTSSRVRKAKISKIAPNTLPVISDGEDLSEPQYEPAPKAKPTRKSTASSSKQPRRTTTKKEVKKSSVDWIPSRSRSTRSQQPLIPTNEDEEDEGNVFESLLPS